MERKSVLANPARENCAAGVAFANANVQGAANVGSAKIKISDFAWSWT